MTDRRCDNMHHRTSGAFAHDFIRCLRNYQTQPRSRRSPYLGDDNGGGGGGGDESTTFSLSPEGGNEPHSAFPCYNAGDAGDVSLLVATSSPREFVLGTGASIWTTRLIPAILSAREEVLITTCFWAKSPSLDALAHALAWLAGHRRDSMASAADAGARPLRQPTTLRPLRIHICFSSRSFLSLIGHTSSRAGHVYPPEQWLALGLPDPAVLEAGAIELRVKSIFLKPLSVMHPKFVIVDRRRALLPSCNVSWEPWLEGCVDIEGDTVKGLVSFYQRTWAPDLPADLAGPDSDTAAAGWVANYEEAYQGMNIGSTIYQSVKRPNEAPPNVATLMLPHPSHRNPHFRPFPCQPVPPPPATPLNVAQLLLFAQARRSIYVQTPNLTSRPVIAALLDAVGRGVDVSITTCENVELKEQLVTTGRTTGCSVRLMVRRFRKLQKRRAHLSSSSSSPSSWGQRLLAWLRRAFRGKLGAVDRHAEADLEAGRAPMGRLRISFFRTKTGGESRGPTREQNVEDPIRSHLKLTIVDAEYTVLGSGNQDRASWYTSQELGILFIDEPLAVGIRAAVDSVLEGRLQLVLDSALVS